MIKEFNCIIKDISQNAALLEITGGTQMLLKIYDKDLIKEINVRLRNNLLRNGIHAKIEIDFIDRSNIKLRKLEFIGGSYNAGLN